MLRHWAGVLAFLSLLSLVATAVQLRAPATTAASRYYTTQADVKTLSSRAIAAWGSSGVRADGLNSLSSSKYLGDTPVSLPVELIPRSNGTQREDVGFIVTTTGQLFLQSFKPGQTHTLVRTNNTNVQLWTSDTPNASQVWMPTSAPKDTAVDNHQPPVGGSGNGNSSKGPRYDALRYLDKPKLPDVYNSPRPSVPLPSVTGDNTALDITVLDVAAAATRVTHVITNIIIPRAMALLRGLSFSMSLRQHIPEVESHVYTDYSQMQQDVTAALHGAAAGTTTNPMLWSSSLQVAMEGHQITTYAMVATGVVHHTNGNATGTTTSPQQHNAAQSAAQTTSQQPAARDGQQSHGGADAGGSGDGGGDDNQHRGSATTTANATAQPTKLPSLEDIIGVGDSAMLSLLGVKYESLSQVQQRSHAWHQARVVRITARHGLKPNRWFLMYIKSSREQLKRAERQYPAIPNLAAAGASLLCLQKQSA